MNDRALADLLAAVIAHPDDDAARLVYADALTSMGDPHGEFIIVQVALAALGVATLDDIIEAPPERLSDADAARAGALLRRENELLAEHALSWVDAWLGEAPTDPDLRKTARFRRGFVSHVSISGLTAAHDSMLIAKVFERRSAPPLESIYAGGRDAELDCLRQAGCLDRLRSLTIGGVLGSDSFKRAIEQASELEHIGAISYSPSTLAQDLEVATSKKLRSLTINGITPELAMRAPCMRSIRHLDLFHYGDRALDLLDVSLCPELEEVRMSGLNYDRIGERAFEVPAAFKKRQPLPKLKKLRFETQHGGGESIHEILNSNIASTIEEIAVVGDGISERTLEVVVASRSITKVDLDQWKCKSLRSLARQQQQKSFEKICIDLSSSIDEQSLTALLSQNSSLRILKLGGRYGKMTHEGKLLDVLARHAPASLRSLTLEIWDLSQEDRVRALVEAPQLRTLRALELSAGKMGDGGACAVGEAPMPNLVRISLVGNPLGERGMCAFLNAREHFPALALLILRAEKKDAPSYAALDHALGPILLRGLHL